MVSPMTLFPSARSMAATVEESTPPDIATAIVSVVDIVIYVMARSSRLAPRGLFPTGGQFPQPADRPRPQPQSKFNVLRRIHLPQTKSNTSPSPFSRHPHGHQNMRRLNRARRTSRPSRNRQPTKIQR